MLKRIGLLVVFGIIRLVVLAQLPFITHQLTEANGLLSNYIQDLAWDDKDRLWIGTDKGATMYDGIRMKHFTTAEGLKHSYVAELEFCAEAKKMLLRTSDLRMYVSNGISLEPVILPKPGLSVNKFITIGKGVTLVILADSKGVQTAYALHWKNERPYWVLHKEKVGPEPLENDPVLNYGTWTWPFLKGRMAKFSDKGGYLDQAVLVNEGDTSSLLLSEYATGNLVLVNYRGDKIELPKTETGLSVISTLRNGPGGTVFIGTLGKGLIYFNPSGGTLAFGGMEVNRIEPDATGCWVVASNALAFYPWRGSPVFSGFKVNDATAIKTDSQYLHAVGLTEYQRFPKLSGGQLGKPVYRYRNTTGLSGYSGNGNGFLLSTYTVGILSFDAGGRQRPSPAVFDRIIEGIFPFKGGQAYTSYSSGVFLQYNNGASVVLNKDSGLLSNTVYYATVFGDTSWICTDHGLSFRCNGQVTNMGPLQGFAGKKCLYTFSTAGGIRFAVSDECLMRLEGNRLRPLRSVALKPHGDAFLKSVVFDTLKQVLLLGTSHGMVVHTSRHLAPDSAVAGPVWVNAMAGTQSLMNPLENYVLDGSNKPFIFDLGFDRMPPGKSHKMLYKLEGWNDDWLQVPADYRLHFPQLAAGQYRLLLQSVNADGVSSKVKQVTVFTIARPWYFQWYMLLCYAMVLSGLAWIGAQQWARRKYRRKLETYRLHQQLENERNRISSELHDNVGSHLTTIIAQLDYLENTIRHQKQATAIEKVTGLQEKARYAMGQLRESIWALKEESVSLKDFVLKIQWLGREILDDESGIQLDIGNQAEDQLVLSPWQAVNLLRVLQEGIQNIRKHAHANHVILSISQQPQGLYLELKDNGVGFDWEGMVAPGQGLPNMQRRINDMSGQITIQTSKGGGTAIIIIIPVEKL